MTHPARAAPDPPVTGPLAQLCVALLALAAGWLLLLGLDPATGSRELALGSAVAASALALLAIALRQGGTLLGVGGVYLTYLTLSHLGLVGVLLLVDSPPSLAGMPPWTIGWADSPAAVEAAVLAGLGICAATLALLRPWDPPGPSPPIARTTAGPGLVRVGFVLIGVTGVYLAAAAATGLLPLGRGYLAYREAMALLPGYSLILVSLATGLTFLAATAERRHLVPALVLASVPVGILMLSGNRGEVLYPGIAALGILARRGLHPPRRLWLGGLLALFVVIPVIGATRTAEPGAASAQDWSPDALFTELGFTLRPFAATVEWRADDEPPAMGRTYVIPLVRGLLRVVPVLERPTVEDTPWDVAVRLEGQGYSVVAEAFLNFGVPGVPLVMALVGLLLGLVDRTRTDLGLARGGGLLAIGMNNIRNGFVFVPGQVVLILALAAVGAWLGRRQGPALTRGRTATTARRTARRSAAA